MESILNIAFKDLKQMIRDRKSFLFLLIMPIAFTYLFGLAFSGSGSSDEDTRLPVGFLNLDTTSQYSQKLETLLENSTAIRLVDGKDEDALKEQLTDEKITAALIIPAGYGDSLPGATPAKLTVYVDPFSSDGLSAQTEIGTQTNRLVSAIHTAQAVASEGGASFDQILDNALISWQDPPVKLVMNQTEVTTAETDEPSATTSSFAHSSPGMILQFAVAGLITCATVIISERKNRCLQRLLTTATNRTQILFGHYLAIFLLIMAQFIILMVFGDLVLKLNYFSQPLATLLITVTSSLCIAALGLLIGVVARVEEQAISFSLICMFVLAGVGGAWVPLEYTGKTFQTIGHVSPLAWAMDGFKNVLVRGLDVQSAWLPAAALLGYAVLFFGLAAWKFKSE